MPCFRSCVPGHGRSKADFYPCCSLLSPVGEHRSQTVTPSKGKRARKRKRKHDARIQNQSAAACPGGVAKIDGLIPPEIHSHLTVGFNTTTRYLELLAQKTGSNIHEDNDSGSLVAVKTPARSSLDSANIKPLVAVFVPRSDQPPVLYSHLPLLAKAASLAVPSLPPTRIVSLPEGAEDRLKTVLGIPRVGMVGLIGGAPDASSLIEFIRENVPELEVPWLQEAVNGAYLAVQINATQAGASLNLI